MSDFIWTSITTTTTFTPVITVSNEDGLWSSIDGVWCLNGVPFDGQDPNTKAEWKDCPFQPKKRG